LADRICYRPSHLRDTPAGSHSHHHHLRGRPCRVL